jgi:hypothetical protein
MKRVFLLTLVIVALQATACNGQQSKNQAPAAGNDKVEVIYFHTTSRCVTCKTVENEARNYIGNQYAGAVQAGKISFVSLNIEEPAGKAVADRVGVSSQSLMIVKGEYKENIINDGFMYAVNRPEKFREIIKSKVDPLLK